MRDHHKNYFLKHNKIKYVKKNLIDEIKKQKEHTSIPFFSLDKSIVGESINSKLNKITKYLKKNKCDYITPVPGGVGPMTIAVLMKNIVNIAENIHNIR